MNNVNMFITVFLVESVDFIFGIIMHTTLLLIGYYFDFVYVFIIAF